MTIKFTERAIMSAETGKAILHWVTGEKTLALVLTDLQPRLCRSFPGKTAAPTVNDDGADGYIEGDVWIDETNDKAYICLDNANDAAVWTEITGGGGSGGGDMYKSVYDTDNDGVVDDAEKLAGTTPTAAGLALLDDADAATQRTTLGLGTIAVEAATDYVPKSLYDANTILGADTDNTPTARTIGEAQIVGRQTGGSIGGISQVSSAEKIAGTETALRGFSPADIRSITNSHAKHVVFKTVSDPAGYYNNDRAQIPLFDSFRGALTVTAIRIRGNDSTPTSELTGDLKFADDIFDGSFANATVIDVCDTTNGAFTATSGFDDATVPANKFIYFQMDSDPHSDWKDFYIEVEYQYDD